MLKRLTMKRKAELLEQYPNADAIGKAYAQDFIDQQIEAHSAGHQHVLTKEEIDYLLEVLPSIATNDKERESYNRYVRLRKALVKIINSWLFFFETFMHRYYMTLYLLKGVSIGFKAILFAKEAPDDFWKTCIYELGNMNDSLETSWEDFRFSIKALLHGDFIIATLEKTFGLDFTDLRPNTSLCKLNFILLKGQVKDAADTLEQYRQAEGIKDKRHLTPNTHTEEVFKRIQQTEFDTLKITSDKQYIIRKLIEERGATAATMDDAMAVVYS